MFKPLSEAKLINSLVNDAEVDILRQAVIDAEMERANLYRSTHPRLYSGWLGYAERVALLRERLPAEKWEPFEDHNQAGVRTMDGKARILPITGDERTGCLDGPGPRTLAKGVCTYEAVRANFELVNGHEPPAQVSLFPPRPDLRPPGEMLTILLIVFRDDDRLRAEVSIPVEMVNAGNFTTFEFHERKLVMDESIAAPAVDLDEEECDPIDIAIDEI